MEDTQIKIVEDLISRGQTPDKIAKTINVMAGEEKVTESEVNEYFNSRKKKEDSGVTGATAPQDISSYVAAGSSESTLSEEDAKPSLVNFNTQLPSFEDERLSAYSNYLLDTKSSEKDEKGVPLIGYYNIDSEENLNTRFQYDAVTWADESGALGEGVGVQQISQDPDLVNQATEKFIEHLQQYSDYTPTEDKVNEYIAGSIYADLAQSVGEIEANQNLKPSEKKRKTAELMDQYVEEFISKLPEDQRTEENLERISEMMYDRHGLRLDFDGDHVYNEGPWIRALLAPAASAGAAALDLVSGPISVVGGLGSWVARNLDDDPSNNSLQSAIHDIDQAFAGASSYLRENHTRDYQDISIFSAEDLSNSPMHMIGYATQTIGEVAPYMAMAVASPTVMVGGMNIGAGLTIGGSSFVNTFIDSQREDAIAIEKGETPVFDFTATGEGYRFVYALGSGVLEAGTGILFGGMVSKAAGQTGGTTTDLFRKIFMGEKNPATRAQILKVFAAGAGADTVLEAGEEAAVALYQGWAEMTLGNREKDWDSVWENVKKSAEAGALGGGGMTTVTSTMGARTAISELPVGSRISNADPNSELAINAAATSQADEANVSRFWFGLDPANVDFENQIEFNKAMGGSPFNLEEGDKYTTANSARYQEEVENHKKTHRDKYRALRLRNPKAWLELQSIDREIASVLEKGTRSLSRSTDESLKDKVQEKEAGRIPELERRYIDLVKRRRKIYADFEFDGEFTAEEKIKIDDAVTASKIDMLGQEVRNAEAILDARNEEAGSEAENVLGRRRAEENVEKAKRRQQAAQELAAQVDNSRDRLELMKKRGANPQDIKDATLDLSLVERDLADLLDMKTRGTGANRSSQDTEVKKEAPKSNWSAADQSANHFEDADAMGSTFTLDGIDHAGKPMASVSIFNERSEVVEGELTQEELTKKLEDFKEKNNDLLEGNEDILAIGTFYSPESKQTFIDISTVIPKKPAEALGKEYNQESVWDLEFMNAIPTGGDGGALQNPKSEAERVLDIRGILRDSDEQAKGRNRAQRGIDGQYRDIPMGRDGKFNAQGDDVLDQDVADFINDKLSKTLKEARDGKVTIRVHSTVESGNYADGEGVLTTDTGVINGLAVEYEDGGAVIHISPEALKLSGKDAKSVLIEETLHLSFGPGFRKLAPKNAKRIVKDLERISKNLAKTMPELDGIVEKAERKRKQYKGAGKSENEVLEEVAFEYLSELGPHIDVSNLSNQDQNILMRMVNEVLAALGLPTISDPSAAIDMLKRVSEMYREGNALGAEKVTDAAPTQRESRSGYSVMALAENEKFTVRFNKPLYYNRGELSGMLRTYVVDHQDFNGKWHFINWWKRATKMGLIPYNEFEIYNPLEGIFEPLNVDAMKKWKMKPPTKRESQEERRIRIQKQKNEIQDTLREVLKQGLGDRWSYQNSRQELYAKVFPKVLGEKEAKEHYEKSDPWSSKQAREYYPGILEVEQLTDLVAAVEEELGLRPPGSGSDVVTQNANEFLFDLNNIRSIEDLDKRVAETKRYLSRYRCGGETNECKLRGDREYLATYLDLIHDALQGDFSVNAAAELLEGMVLFQEDLRLARGQRSLRDLDIDNMEMAQRVTRMIENKYKDNPGIIPENARDFQDLFLTIAAITSNGNRALPNLKVAISLFDALLKGLEGGADMKNALSERIINGIREYNPEVTGGNVRGGRAQNVANELQLLLEYADKFYNVETGEFDSQGFVKGLVTKRRGQEGPRARDILGKGKTGDAEKIGEFAAGLLGKGEHSYLAKELWVDRVMSAMQGNFDLNIDAEDGMVLLNYREVPNIQEYLATEGVTEEQSRQALKNAGVKAWDTTNDPTDLAIGGLLHQKHSPDVSFNQRKAAMSYFNRLLGRDQLESPKSDPKVTRATIKKTAERLNARLAGSGAKRWTPFAVQQALWESAQETMGYFKDGEYKPVDYLVRLEEIEEDGDWNVIDDLFIDPGAAWYADANQNSKRATNERASMQLDMFSNAQNELEVLAHESPLFRVRGIANIGLVNGEEMNERMIMEALSTDATSRRIMSENNEVKDGDIVAVRLNLNVKKNTGVPVQTIHDKTASGKALQYSGAVTLRNVKLDVNQNAREKIVTFRENKFPMAAVVGEFVSKGVDEANLDGVRATFNPFREHLFVDAAGRPIKSAEEATIIGGNVILRGKIEYYDPADPIAQRGFKETDKNKADRLNKGSQNYEGNLRRFKAFSEKVLGAQYNSVEELEKAYEDLSVSSKVALSESEVAERMATANERASITEFTKDKRLRSTARKQAARFGGVTREDIINNPSNYIKPQKIKEIKEDLTAYTDGELVSFMTDESIGRLSQRNDDIGVLAGAELLNRAIMRGETDRIPGLIAELAAMGTSAGRILRHFRELKGSNPRSLASIIESAVKEKGNELTEDQKAKLNDLCDKLFAQQARVEDLMKRAIAGEQVDAEFERALQEMQATERQLDTFTNAMVEKDWGTLFKQLVQGNLLTPFSQIVNVGANMVNMMGKVVVDTASLPVEFAMVKLGRLMGKNLEMKRKPSLMAYMYAMKRFGQGFVEAADQIVTGQDKEISEWRINRGFAPVRSLMAAWSNDLPMGPDGTGSSRQKAKLIIQGTLGIPAETMFRFLSLGDIPFRRWAEAKELYQIGLSKGLEGEALERFLKYPNKTDQESARIEGRKLTFQEEGFVSGATNRLVSSMEGALAAGLQMIPGIKDGSKFSRALFGVILPYRMTPANILQETFTWVNPYVGIVRMAKDIERKDTEEASKTMTKMMLGAVTLEAAMMMIKEGIISGPVDWQDDEKRNMAYDLFPPSCINVSALRRMIEGGDPSHQPDDTFIQYDKLGMFGAIMATAVQTIDKDDLADIKSREYGGPIDFTTHMLGDFFGASSVASISAMMEQSFVQGLNQFLQVLIGDNVERDLEQFITTAFRAGSAAVLPNTLSSLYKSERVFLPDTRTTKDMSTLDRILTKFEYTLKDRTFGLSEVPIRVDWKGQDIKQTPRGTGGYRYQMFDLTKARQGSADPLSNEVWRLYEQTEELADICSTPGYAEKRAVAVPNISSKKDLRLIAALPKQYSWMKDEEFMSESVYLNVEQINRLMKISGSNRYAMATEVVNSPEYQNANDQDRLEMLKDVADEFNGAKEYTEDGFEPHTIELFNIIQDIYDGRE